MTMGGEGGEEGGGCHTKIYELDLSFTISVTMAINHFLM